MDYYPDTVPLAQEVLASLAGDKQLNDEQLAAGYRALRVLGVPINEAGWVQPIPGLTQEQEWAALSHWKAYMDDLRKRHVINLDKKRGLARGSLDFEALSQERPLEMSDKNEKGKFKEVKHESAGGDVTITSDGSIKLGGKSGNLSVEDAQAFSVAIQNAVNQVRAGGLTLAKTSESNPETYKTVDALAEGDQKQEEKKEPKPSDVLPADNATKPGEVPANTAPQTMPQQRADVAKVQERIDKAAKVAVKDAGKDKTASKSKK